MRKFDPSNLPRPRLSDLEVKSLQIFCDQATSLDLEIGAGVGFQALQYSKNNPQRQLISIERTQEKFEKFNRRFQNHQCPSNLLPVHADAISVVHYLLPSNKIEKVFFYYPNPESKNTHQRWINMPFFGRLLDILPQSAEIQFVTNEQFYFDELITNYKLWPLKIINQRSFKLEEQAPNFRTHFERKYLERGETCHEITFKKILDSSSI